MSETPSTMAGPAQGRPKPDRGPLGGQGGHEVPTVGAISPPGPLREFWYSFSANRGAVIGLGLVVFLLLVALFAPLIAPHEPFLTNSGAFLRPPAWQTGGSMQYFLGTDAIGRDILSRLIHGARLSLSIGLGVVLISVATGIVL